MVSNEIRFELCFFIEHAMKLPMFAKGNFTVFHVFVQIEYCYTGGFTLSHLDNYSKNHSSKTM